MLGMPNSRTANTPLYRQSAGLPPLPGPESWVTPGIEVTGLRVISRDHEQRRNELLGLKRVSRTIRRSGSLRRKRRGR
jgi:hypothetical protein